MVQHMEIYEVLLYVDTSSYVQIMPYNLPYDHVASHKTKQILAEGLMFVLKIVSFTKLVLSRVIRG